MSPKQYVRSLGGQVFLVLLIGVALSACLALGLANIRRLADLDRIHIDRVAERVMDYVILLDRAPAHVREEIRLKGFPGLHPPRGTEVTTGVDSALSTETSERLGRPVRAFNANPPSCLPYAPSRLFHTNTKCWMVYTTLKDGSTLKLATFSPRPDTFAMSPPDAVFLSILGVGVIVLTFFVSRMVSAPLQQLSTAARVLAEDLDSPPVTEQGPTEVRQAIRAFNTMQERLRDNVEEKTRILASITHDLQTPMTRLRLRLEKVTDSALRSRLIDDLRSMQRLVRQGLEYHRGSEVEEPMVVLRLDSLLESVIDDASEGGADVKFIERANCDVEARPEALRRCFSNLIDNALKYGGQAEVYVR